MNKAQHQQRFDKHLQLDFFFSDIFSLDHDTVYLSWLTAVVNLKQINIFCSKNRFKTMSPLH